MKKLIFAVTLITSLVAFSAEKSYEEQYAEAKAGNMPLIMLQLSIATSNEAWKIETYDLAKNNLNNDPKTLTRLQQSLEAWTLDYMIAKKELDTVDGRKWLNNSDPTAWVVDLVVRCDDDVFKYSKKYAVSNNYPFTFATRKNVCDDIVIDTGLNTDFNKIVDINDLNVFVTKLSKISATYRSTDVLKILKDMNKVYTMKMYEVGQEDIYKPLVTKIRALIEIY